MHGEPALAFVTPSEEPPGLSIRVNFGVFAGREATPAEIEELAHALVPEVGDISIVSEQRLEIGEAAEALLHQVRIELDDDRVPPDPSAREELAARLVEIAERWAEACIASRHAEEAPL